MAEGTLLTSLSLSLPLGFRGKTKHVFSNKIALQKQQNDKKVGCSNLNINFLITIREQNKKQRRVVYWYGIMGAKHPILTAIKNRRKEMVVVFCSNKQITT